ncbi:MAG TPA: ankyrin repeat domain-containing protein [Bryobacteraceae bacterium]|nr:ankyrin repeat domain-containing protein [Bryobacteraceae bacterium]
MRRTWMLSLVLGTACTLASAQSSDEKLYTAVRSNDLAGLKSLLEHGVNANSADRREITPLMYAAEIGSPDAMKLLLEHGAEVNAQNAFGSTALMWSVSDPRKVRLLLDHGADVNKVARTGRTALIIAAFTDPSAEVARLLLSAGAKVDVMDRRKVTPLNAATFGNDTETIHLLIEADADMETADTFIGMTPLINAAGSRNLAAVKLLLEHGAKVNAVSKTENLPKIQTGTVEFGGWTPLLMAAPFGPPAVAKTLLDAGAQVNVQDYRGFTPLMLAVGTDRYNRETVRLLLDHGADTRLKNHASETALDWAHKLGDREVIKALGGSVQPASPSALSKDLPDPRTAVEQSLRLLEKTNSQFFAKSGCFACHEQPPTEFAAAAARAKGIAPDEQAARERRLQITSTISSAGPVQLEGPAAIGGADNNLYLVEALVRGGYPPDRVTDFLAANLAAAQGADGGWHLPGYSRSPIQDSDFSRTAMAMRALRTYGTPGRASEMKARMERAKQWLLHAEPVILEDLDMRLVGAAAAGASAAELRKLAQPILTQQRPDGGWAQREVFTSDAYATGMTLWALAEAGVVSPHEEPYRMGVKFLLATQSRDGSWHVASRATKFQQYFESGFPYDDDQWISTMATGWAASALALAIDGTPRSAAVAAVR